MSTSPYLHALLTGPPGVGKTTLIKKVCSILRKHSGGDVRMSGFYTEEVRESGRGRVGFDIVTLDGKRGILARLSSLCSQPVSGAAHSRSRKPPCVGRYTVDVALFEGLALPALQIKSESEVGPISSNVAAGSSREACDQESGFDTDQLKTSVMTAHSVFCDEARRPDGKSSSLMAVTRRSVVVIDEIGKMELFSRSFIDAVKKNFDQKLAKDRVLVLATIPVAGNKTHWLLEELRHRTDCKLFEVNVKNRDTLAEEIAQFLIQGLKQ